MRPTIRMWAAAIALTLAPALAQDGDFDVETASDPVALGAGGESALHRASVVGDAKRIALLLDEGAWVDATDHGGRTPLMLAVAGGHREAVALLLAAGADPSASNGHASVLEYGRLDRKGEAAALVGKALAAARRETIRVPVGLDLQEAVDLAPDGGVLLLEPGVHRGAIAISAKRLTLRGAGAVLVGGDLETVVRVVERGSLSLEDMTLAPEGTARIAVLAEDGEIELDRVEVREAPLQAVVARRSVVVVRGSRFVRAGREAIACEGSSLVVSRSVFEGSAVGVLHRGGERAIVTGCSFERQGEGVTVTDGTRRVRLRENLFRLPAAEEPVPWAALVAGAADAVVCRNHFLAGPGAAAENLLALVLARGGRAVLRENFVLGGKTGVFLDVEHAESGGWPDLDAAERPRVTLARNVIAGAEDVGLMVAGPADCASDGDLVVVRTGVAAGLSGGAGLALSDGLLCGEIAALGVQDYTSRARLSDAVLVPPLAPETASSVDLDHVTASRLANDGTRLRERAATLLQELDSTAAGAESGGEGLAVSFLELARAWRAERGEPVPARPGMQRLRVAGQEGAAPVDVEFALSGPREMRRALASRRFLYWQTGMPRVDATAEERDRARELARQELDELRPLPPEGGEDPARRRQAARHAVRQLAIAQVLAAVGEEADVERILSACERLAGGGESGAWSYWLPIAATLERRLGVLEGGRLSALAREGNGEAAVIAAALLHDRGFRAQDGVLRRQLAEGAPAADATSWAAIALLDAGDPDTLAAMRACAQRASHGGPTDGPPGAVGAWLVAHGDEGDRALVASIPFAAGSLPDVGLVASDPVPLFEAAMTSDPSSLERWLALLRIHPPRRREELIEEFMRHDTDIEVFASFLKPSGRVAQLYFDGNVKHNLPCWIPCTDRVPELLGLWVDEGLEWRWDRQRDYLSRDELASGLAAANARESGFPVDLALAAHDVASRAFTCPYERIADGIERRPFVLRRREKDVGALSGILSARPRLVTHGLEVRLAVELAPHYGGGLADALFGVENSELHRYVEDCGRALVADVRLVDPFGASAPLELAGAEDGVFTCRGPRPARSDLAGCVLVVELEFFGQRVPLTFDLYASELARDLSRSAGGESSK